MNDGISSFERLTKLVREDIRHYGNPLPERVALVWYGYIGGLFDWDIIQLGEYNALIGLLPPIEDNPIGRIFLGWPEEHEEDDDEDLS
jgi:hypothetical protein